MAIGQKMRLDPGVADLCNREPNEVINLFWDLVCIFKRYSSWYLSTFIEIQSL